MAKNGKVGDGHRNGAVKDRSQTLNPQNGHWVKRDTDTGRFIDQKADDKPFKGVTKEKNKRDNMSKLKFTLKIKEFELQVEGTRDEVNTITGNVGQQLQGLMRPSGAMGEPTPAPLQITENGEFTEIKSPTKRRKTQANQPKSEKAKALDFKNDHTKYGAPLQTWSALDKSIWLVYVIQNELQLNELSAGEIAETFNKHFKQQGKIRATNISRDFGKQKAGSKAIVGENSTVFPAKWYLTEEGIKLAQKLIQNLKNGTE